MRLQYSINKINAIYDESNKELDRIIYIHGNTDPWNTLGVSEYITRNTVSIYMKGNLKI